MNCLEALDMLTDPYGEYCVPFAPIMVETGLDRAAVRKEVRALAEQGLAEFHSPLWDIDEGKPCGAGYCITPEGRNIVRGKE